MIHRTPFFLPLLLPSLVWRVPTEEKVLFLTFDDGPVPGPTEFALHTLCRFSAKATFFCIGDNIRKHPDVFHKVIEDGHALGNHTFNHLSGWSTGVGEYVENVRRCEEQLGGRSQESGVRSKELSFGKATGGKEEARSEEPPFAKATAGKQGARSLEIEGLDPNASVPMPDAQCLTPKAQVPRPLFRPPYGRITKRQIRQLNEYSIIMWDVLSMDYNKGLSPEACLRNTINACRTGSIVVFHDSYKAERNMTYVLPRLLEHFAGQGFAFKALPG